MPDNNPNTNDSSIAPEFSHDKSDSNSADDPSTPLQPPRKPKDVIHESIFNSIVESFIPLRHGDLIAKLLARFPLSGQDRTDYLKLCDRLAAIFHIEHLTALLRVEELYETLDPDSEFNDELTEQQLDQRTEGLFDCLTDLMQNAHYVRLSRDQIEYAINLGSLWGAKLEVNFDLFDRIEVYARGYQTVKIKRRRWENLFREEEIDIPEIHRLVLAFRLRGEDLADSDMSGNVVYLKNFKNIPETDLELLLPGSRVRFSILDRGKILLPTVSGLAITIFKIVRVVTVVAVATMVTAIWVWALLLGGLGVYIFKSFLGYNRTKDKYQFDLTRNLYLKNLDNNAGVLYRVFNEAEEQELCEAVLGYTILWKQGQSGLLDKEFDDLAEEFLLEYTGKEIDFDMHDALAKLARLGLAHIDKSGKWTATQISVAPKILSENWRQLFELQQHKVGMLDD